MKIAVSSTGPGLDAEVDPRFGRCQYFVIVDSDTMQSETVENPNVMASGGAGIQSAQLVADKGAEVVLTGNCGPNAFQTLEAAGIPVCVGVAGTVREAVEGYKSGRFTPVSGPSVKDKFGVGGAGGGSGGTGSGQAIPDGMGGGMGRGMGGGRGGGGGMGRGMGGGRGGGGGMGRGMGGGRGGGGGMGPGMGRGMGGGGRGMGRGMGMGGGIWPAGIGGGGMPGGFPAEQVSGNELEALKAHAEALKGQLEQITQRIEEIEKGGNE